jgi:hypothetical protein
MDYLTEYYKNKCQKLQEQIFIVLSENNNKLNLFENPTDDSSDSAQASSDSGIVYGRDWHWIFPDGSPAPLWTEDPIFGPISTGPWFNEPDGATPVTGPHPNWPGLPGTRPTPGVVPGRNNPGGGGGGGGGNNTGTGQRKPKPSLFDPSMQEYERQIPNFGFTRPTPEYEGPYGPPAPTPEQVGQPSTPQRGTGSGQGSGSGSGTGSGTGSGQGSGTGRGTGSGEGPGRGTGQGSGQGTGKGGVRPSRYEFDPSKGTLHGGRKP